MDAESRFARINRFLERCEAERPKLLPPEAREYIKKLSADPALSRAFLIGAGIMGEDGKLAPPYNGEEFVPAHEPAATPGYFGVHGF